MYQITFRAYVLAGAELNGRPLVRLGLLGLGSSEGGR